MKTLICSFVIAIALVQSAIAGGNADVSPEVERAILSEDWKKVIELVPDPGTNSLSPVMRLIKGHACLALNHNNDSVALLYDDGRSEDNSMWAQWTSHCAASHPTSAGALYLEADALAREQKYNDAIQVFTRGLKLESNNVLLLNGRAVCYATLERWNEAIVDLDDAAKANPQLAEVHANRGTMNIRRSLGAPGALAAFDRSLAISPDFVLAKIGKASALFGLGRWAEAQALLEDCKKDANSGHLAALNEALIRDATSHAEIAGVDEKAVGTELYRTVRDRQQNLDSINQGILKDDMARIGHTFVADTMRDMQAPFKAAASTFQGLMDMRSGNFSSGANRLGSVADTLTHNEQNIANLHAQLSQAGTAHWDQGMNSLMNLRSSGLQGGVATEDLRRSYLDKGNWRLLARFALQYPEPQPAVQQTEGRQ